jgi:septal ring factor EnvC (AmiA/AmiB activator)
MKLGCRLSLLFVTLAFVAGCGPSQADYDRAKRQMQLVTTERDNLKSQLDQATAKIQTLQQQVTTLQAAATAKPENADEASASAKTSSKKKHGRTTKARKHGKKH